MRKLAEILRKAHGESTRLGEKTVAYLCDVYLAFMDVAGGSTDAPGRLEQLSEISSIPTDARSLIVVNRLLGLAQAEFGKSEFDKSRGMTLLKETLSYARQSGIVPEISWTERLITRLS